MREAKLVTRADFHLALGSLTTREHADAIFDNLPVEHRAPVQGERGTVGPGTVPWSTHLAAWSGYAAAGHASQSAARLAERGGFSYRELQCAIAGHYNLTGQCRALHPVPDGWRPGA